MQSVGLADYRVRVDKFIKIPLYYCNRCDIFSKGVNDKLLDMHFNSAGYVRLEHEERYKHARYKFFDFLLALISKEVEKENLAILDVGCSYGHFLEAGKRKGYSMEGVEINDLLYSRLIKSGYGIYKSIYEIQKRYDVISFIDSFYYFKDPLDILERCRNLMREDGLLLFRLTNRNWLARLTNNPNILGDATHSFSLKSISKALYKKDFKIIRIEFLELRKNMPIRKKLCYLLTYLFTLTILKTRILTPGLIVFAKKIK